MLVHVIIIDVFGNVREQLLADLIRRFVKYDDIDRHFVFKKKVADDVDSNLQSLILRISVHARRDKRESNRFTAPLLRKRQRLTIAGFKQGLFAVFAVVIDRTDGMYDIFRRQMITTRDLRLAGLTTAKRSALGKQARTCGTVNRTVNTSTAEQRLVCGIDNGIHLHFCYIVSYYF